MPHVHRTRLALLRLCLAFVILCLLLSQFEVAVRALRNQTLGLPNPLIARDPQPTAGRLPFLGVSIDPAAIDPADLAAQLELLAASGFGWVRVRVAWDRVELAPRTFAWDDLDRTLAALEATGLTPVLLLDGSPAWARAPNDRRGAEGRLAPPANAAAFARFARSVADRYAERVRYYQIWDEPNIAPHWGARRIEPVNYARLLKAASTAIRLVDRDAYIILAALAPTADRGHLAQDESYFLNRVYAAGAAPYFDAVAIQPFGFARRPDDAAVDRYVLNFRRTLLIRQTMLAAGDGATPLWLMRFGWNRAPGSPWQSVDAGTQRTFTRAALAMAYQQWPWVVGMGWPAAFVDEYDPQAGFSLTPALLETFQQAAETTLTQRRPRATASPSLALWMPAGLWLLAIAVTIWRGTVAARRLPWRAWGIGWATRPAWQQGLAWAGLLLLYHLAVWPPLILLYAIVAALGFYVQPRIGLALALVLLPFYDYHKEFDWLGQHWRLPPTQAVLLCMLPAIWRYYPRVVVRDRWQGVALGWLVVMLLSALGVWYWPAYATGMVNLVITPLALFLLLRAWVTTTHQGTTMVVALTAGGMLIALVGLISWLQGSGTEVDGMRRLTGLGYSSNHTALYLIRTLALTVGLAMAARGIKRWWWLLWMALIGVALLLTGSRGAILLGVPAGALFVFSRQDVTLPSGRRLLLLLLVGGMALVTLGWFYRNRLDNVESVLARMDGWIVALYLWFDHMLVGVGPDGLLWTFPGYMWLASDADPNLRHPHLIWLEMATSGGLLALGWLVVTAYLLVQWVREQGATLTWLQVGLLAGLIAGFAHAQMDAFQALAELAGWNWAALALLLALDRVEVRAA